MKTRIKREYPPYYVATPGVISVLYFWTLGTYLNDAPKTWIHNRTLAYVISFVLFMAGFLICYKLFDHFFPKLEAKRATKNQTRAPLLLRVTAFIIDLIVSFVVFTYLVALATGHATSNGFSLSGWQAGLPVLLVFVYFIVMDNYLGGTLAKRLFRIR